MRRRKVFISTAATAVLGVAIALGGAVPAQANTWTDYCLLNVHSDDIFDTYLSTLTQCRVQGGPALAYANDFRYTGPVDGAMGVNSWKGFQSWLRIYGYGGPVDGIPGTNTYRAIQEYARQTGFYSGPVDGVMGPNSWWGLTRSLHATFYNQ